MAEVSRSTAQEIDRRIAENEVIKALALMLNLHEQADGVQLRADMRDGRASRVEVSYSLKGAPLGGFGL